MSLKSEPVSRDLKWGTVRWVREKAVPQAVSSR